MESILTEMPGYLERFREKRILVIGDIMLDRFIWGSVDRISPEAPVPVVTVDRESRYPGGAANVARNLAPFAGRVFICGWRGEDANGELLEEALLEGGVDASGVLCDGEYETICKTRVIARQQQVVRIDRERRQKLPAEALERAVGKIGELMGEVDAVILEDYAKGFVTEELAVRVVALAKERGVPVTVDPNPKNPLPWRGVTAVKPNRPEAFAVAGVEDVGIGEDPLRDPLLAEVGERLLATWDAPMVLVTLGELGMMLFERGAEPFHIPTRAKEVFDVSGAGDTAIALFTLALAAGLSAREAAEVSNVGSGKVVGKLGTAVLAPDDLLL